MYIEKDPRYTAFDGMSTETVVCQFMGWLVRMMKPNVVLETGCYQGHTSIEIGQALQENGSGTLWTCETHPSWVEYTHDRTCHLPVKILNITGVELAQKVKDVELAFLDSSGDRVGEALVLQMTPQGIVVLHDAHRPTMEQIAQLTGWQRIKFNTPRGLGMFQVSYPKYAGGFPSEV